MAQKMLIVVLLLLLRAIVVATNERSMFSIGRERKLVTSPLPLTEQNALQKMYTSLGGASWKWHDVSQYGPQWDMSKLGGSDVCKWQGIQCDCYSHKLPEEAKALDFYYDDAPALESSCHVTKLQLISMGLSGTIPPEIKDLTSLTVLQLIDNKISGRLVDLATSLGNLKQLTKLHLSKNLLEGGFPTYVGDLVKLKSLWFDENKLSGDISADFSVRLKSLRSLRLNKNGFSSFPDSIVRNLVDATDISVANNALTSDATGLIKTIFDHPKIVKVDLSHNRFAAGSKVPNPWAGETANRKLSDTLRVLILSTMNLAGEFPKQILENHDLAELDLSGNVRLSGVLPKEACFAYNGGATKTSAPTPGSSPKLKSLILSGTTFHGVDASQAIPPEIGYCSNLEILDLARSLFKGSLPETLGQLTQLTKFDVGGNQISGTIVDALGSMIKLKVFAVDKNQLEGTLPLSLQGLTDLVEFRVAHNHFRGLLPPEYSKWTKLESFHVESNDFVGEPPSSYSAWSEAKEVAMGNNRLSGRIPDYSTMTLLELLDLGDNSKDSNDRNATHMAFDSTGGVSGITGSIPAWIGTSTTLKQLLLAANKLTGSCPPGLGANKNLVVVRLYSNSISGSLQEFVSTQLTDLLVENNALSGKLPSFSKLTNLKVLHLDNNKFTGSLPSDLDKSPNLVEAQFGRNSLSGAIPVSFGKMSKIAKLLLNDNSISGELPIMSGTLEVFKAANNRLTAIPASFAPMKSIRVLDLANNIIVCANLPSDMSQLKNLEELYLTGNAIQGTLEPLLNTPVSDKIRIINIDKNKLSKLTAGDATKLGNLKAIEVLEMSDNKVEDILPESIGKMVSLRELRIGKNLFKGTLPSQLGSLRNLELILAAQCKFTGVLPKTIGDLPNLKVIDFSGNLLSGSIPFLEIDDVCLRTKATMQDKLACVRGLAKAPSLTEVQLNDNNFSGKIVLPNKEQGIFGDFHKLRRLMLGGNELTGSVPPQVGVMTDLVWLGLAHNKLSGVIPQELGACQNLVHLELQNNQFNGAFPPLYCFVDDRDGFVNITANNFDCFDSCWETETKLKFSKSKQLDPCPLNPKCPKGNTLPPRMMVALRDLFMRTHGDGKTEIVKDPKTGIQKTVQHNGWKWKDDVTRFGARWDFTMSDDKTCFMKDPCLDKWQGVDCSCADGDSDQGKNHVKQANENFYYDDKNDIPNKDNKCFVQKLELVDMGLEGELPEISMRELQGMTHIQLAQNALSGSLPSSIAELSASLILLDVAGNALTGSLPTWIGKLSSLKVLMACENDFSGAIPTDVGSLKQIEVLKFSDNRLVGNIPSQISGLAELRVLWLFKNGLEDALPDLTGLVKLQKFDVSNNHLIGKIPLDKIGASCKELIELHLDGNGFTGPLPILVSSTFPKLTVLDLGNNQLVGSVPGAYVALPVLEELYLNDCLLKGTLSSLSGASVRLRVLDISSNNITGIIPDLSKLTALEEIELRGNMLDGLLPTTLSTLTRLRSLGLSGNKLRGGVSSIAFDKFVMLEHLWLDNNAFTNTLPTSLGSMTKLKVLHLNNNRFTGVVKSSLGDLISVEEVDVSNNLLKGGLPTAIGKLVNLVTLEASMSGIAVLPSDIGQCKKLRVLNMGSNNMTGTIPSQVFTLPDLESLDLSNNRLRGSIPALTAKPSKLGNLILFGNSLSGSIPASVFVGSIKELRLEKNSLVGQLTNLENLVNAEVINLSNNKIEGALLDGIGKLKRCRLFDASANALTGTIPADIGEMRNLKRLYLFDNRMDGGVSEELAKVDGLQVLDISINSFDGKFPFSSLRNLHKLEILRAHHNKLSDSIDAAVGDMDSLKEIDLSVNELTGSLPSTIAKLTDLISFDVSGNMLTGTIPYQFESLKHIRQFYLDHNKFGGVFGKLFCLDNPQFEHDSIVVNITGPGMAIKCFDKCWTELLSANSNDRLLHNRLVDGCPTPAPHPNPAPHPTSAPRPTHIGHPTSPPVSTPPHYMDYDQVMALQAMYDKMGGTQWRWRMGDVQKVGIKWNFEFEADKSKGLKHDPCKEHWQGVICSCKKFPVPPHADGFYYDDDAHSKLPPDTTKCFVSKLQMVGMGLKGPLPDEVWAFTGMTHAQLSENDISGKLPAVLKEWRKVEKLHFSHNKLEGPIDGFLFREWGDNLRELWLDFNDFSGTIPSDVGVLVALEKMRLSDNKLVGSLPAELKSLKSLEELFVHNNKLEGKIDVVAELKHLRNASFADNAFHGELPSNINTLRFLESFTLSRNKIGGVIPADFAADGGSLRFLDMGTNLIKGTIPSSLVKLEKLEVLVLGGNKDLQGTLPKDLGTMKALRELNLANTGVGGLLPESFSDLKSLEVLDLSNSHMKGEAMPEYFGDFSFLRVLNLEKCQFKGTLPSAYSKLSRLEVLNLQRNLLRGGFSAELGACKNLKSIQLDFNHFAGQLPTSTFGKFDRLEKLTLDRNFFEGQIPGDIGGMTSLQVLSLGGNKFDGTIPDLAPLKRLTNLVLGGNKKIRGPIPMSITSMQDLEVLHLGDNQITGTIPADLVKLIRLKTLWLFNNALHGSIPLDIFDKIDTLEDFNAGFNGLSGILPATLSKAKHLIRFKVEHNKLTSPIPDFSQGSLKDTLQELTLGYNGFSDGTLPASIFALTSLRVLDFQHNSIRGSIPNDLQKLIRLEQLGLAANSLTGPLPTVLLSLTALEGLDVSRNQLNGELPPKFFFDGTKGLRRARKINLSFNRFSGKLPSLKGLDTLEALIVNDNKFTDFPADLDAQRTLQQIDAHNNVINAELPGALFKIATLTEILIGNNKIRGVLPDNFGDMTQLRIFRAPDNAFTGKLPMSASSCQKLVELDLSRNSLDGTIPFWALAKLSKLKVLALTRNKFDGYLTDQVSGMKSLEVLQLDGNKLKGPLPGSLSVMGSLIKLALGDNLFDHEIPYSLSSLTSLTDLQLQKNKFDGKVPALFCQSGRTLPAINVTNNYALSCYTDCLGKNPTFFHDKKLPQCSNWIAPSQPPVPGPPPSARPPAPTPTAPKLSGSTQVHVSMYLANVDFASISNDVAAYKYVLMSAILNAIGNDKITSSSIVSFTLENDADGATDDDESRSRVSRSNERSLAALATVSCSFYIGTSAKGVSYDSLKSTLETSKNAYAKLTTAINSAAKKSTATAFATATVVATHVVNVAPAPKQKSNSMSNVTEEPVDGGAVAGVVIGLSAFFALAFVAFHYRERLCPQLVNAYNSSATTDKNAVPQATDNDARFLPQTGRRDSIPLHVDRRASATGLTTTVGRLDPGEEGERGTNAFSMTSVYQSKNPMFAESERDQDQGL